MLSLHFSTDQILSLVTSAIYLAIRGNLPSPSRACTYPRSRISAPTHLPPPDFLAHQLGCLLDSTRFCGEGHTSPYSLYLFGQNG